MVLSKRKPSSNYSPNPNCMEDLYIFHDELGSGGFGKVKLATHVLSGEKVAVKVIDKKAVGEDLPRVATELDALKHIAHQNICRMFQYVETDEKYYIVMEYCNGGEMFDYIVRKERLEESEARHFFRQLVQAIAYIHSVGFAHRDLKPENLLLKEDLQLKVIDFGLCARPRNGLGRPLETCCGSPAYAAPELIQNSQYYGNEADIWSMGVLLYALLCGALPFEDADMPRLYRKIMQGVYHEPAFLSSESRALLRSMLTINPRLRITIRQLLVHPWLNKNYNQPLKFTTIYDKDVIDEDVARELSFFYSTTTAEMIRLLKEWRFDYVTATYLILLQKKERKQKFALPFFRGNGANPYSPTIHASLETDLDQQGHLDDERWFDRRRPPAIAAVDRYNCESPFEKSYAKAIELGSPLYNSPQRQIQRIFCRTNPNPANAASLMKELSTPKRQVAPSRDGKENQRPAVSVLNNRAAVAAAVGFDDGGRPKSVYSTPRRGPPGAGIFTPAYRRPRSVERAPTAITAAETAARNRPPAAAVGSTSNECLPSSAAVTAATEENSGRRRTPRSEMKSPRLRQRVFKSLERQADRVIHLLTPRRMRPDNGAPVKVKAGNAVTLSVTSSTDPYQVRDQLVLVLTNLGIAPVQNGWKVSGSKKSADGVGGQVTVEYEVVLLDNMDYVGVKRRRLSGDAFLYKRVCEEVLKFASL